MEPIETTIKLTQGYEVIALIPAAGKGNRLAPIPGSKEVFPLGFRPGPDGKPEVKVLSQGLFERLAHAGIRLGIILIRQGKWDIPAFYGEGEPAGMRLAYVVVDETHGPPDTLDRAYPFVRSCIVAFGFPDILLGPADVYDHLLTRLNGSEVDAVLGLYEVQDRANSDMVELDEHGLVRALALKDRTSKSRYCWGCAVWKPGFTEYLKHFIQQARSTEKGERYVGLDASGDLPMGLVFKGAVEEGLRVAGVPFPGESWIDVGNRDTLARLTAEFRVIR